jgi:SAM-dependent methyltransferase
MSHYEPKEPFDGYDPGGEYPAMMDFCVAVETYQANKLGAWLLGKLAPHSVIDVGCGPGMYLVPFAKAGCVVFGVDACPTAGGLLKKRQFQWVDLRFPFAPEVRYDLAICFEVAEHLERHWSERLIDSLRDCADIVLFSGAVPGQGGTYHINEQPHEFWIKLFDDRGYMLHPLQDEMRTFLNTMSPERERNEVSGWLLDNTFLFVARGGGV